MLLAKQVESEDSDVYSSSELEDHDGSPRPHHLKMMDSVARRVDLMLASHDTSTESEEDVRAEFNLASFLGKHNIASRVAAHLKAAQVGVASVGDIQRRTLGELQSALGEAGVAETDQIVFLRHLRASSVLPRGIKRREDFALK